MARPKSKQSAGASDASGSALIRFVLRPVVRFCVRRSVKLQELIEVMKVVFVEVGQEELRGTKESSSVSRLSVMTGVHRKDVHRLLTEGMKTDAASDVFTRVVGQWQNDPRFATKAGKPKALSFSSAAGAFTELVRSVSRELNPYTVLFELERQGMIERKGDNLLLKVQSYTPSKNPSESYRLLSQDIDDLMRGVEDNTFSLKGVPHLHLTTSYDNVPVEYLPSLRAWCMREGTKLHRRARNQLSKFDKDLNPKLKQKSGRARIALGTFSFSEVAETTDGEEKK